MLPHSATPNATDVVQSCPNKKVQQASSATDVVDTQQHHCYGCRYGGVDRRRAAVARCLADVIHSHGGTKVFIEEEVPALTRVVNGQREHARMDLVFNLNGSVTYLDVSITWTALVERNSHSKLQSVWSVRPCGYTVTTPDTLCSTTPALSALEDYGLRHKHNCSTASVS